jgi:glycosyltransferase involved in cell wall biosynthesis
MLELPQRKLLVYHNITPARYFWSSEPRVAVTCEQGREHLPAFVAAAHLAAAVSGYNADELRSVGARDPRVVPVLVDPERLRPRSSANGTPGAGPLVLSVGRLAPHKRPDLVIRAFALYQRQRRPDARLLLAGPPLNPSTRAGLEELVRELGVRHVRVAGGLPQAELNAAFAEADAFVSMSEHEGFCVPLLEALSAGVPAVARPVGGMPEVGGDAVLWAPGDDLAVVAELLHLAVSDDELRAELRSRAGERVARFSYDRVAGEVRSVVEEALA